jgi:hypothetical protein
MSGHNDLSLHGIGSVQVGKHSKCKSMGKFTYRNTNQFVLTASQGYSAFDFLEVIAVRAAFQAGVGNGNRADRLQIDIDLFALNPYAQQPNSALFPTGTSLAVASNDVIYLNSVESKISLLSMESVAQIVEIMWVTPKHDTSIDPVACFNASLFATGYGQAVGTTALDTATTAVTSGYEYSGFYGLNPFENPMFSKQYKLLKAKRVVLQPGDQYHCALNLKYGQYINRDTITNHRQETYLRDLTVIPLLVARGGLAGIGPTTTTTEVAFVAPKVGCVHDYKIVLNALPNSRQSVTRSFQGVVSLSAQTMKHIDQDDDVQNRAVLV